MKKRSFDIRDDMISSRSKIVLGKLMSLGISQRVVAWRLHFWQESKCVHSSSLVVSRCKTGDPKRYIRLRIRSLLSVSICVVHWVMTATIDEASTSGLVLSFDAQ